MVSQHRRYFAGFLALLLALSVGCSSGGSSPKPTVAPQATATAAPTVAAGAIATKLPPALMAMERVNTLVGSNVQTQRDKVTDPALPFSSVPSIAGVLTAQSVSLLYNSFQAGAAPPVGRPLSVQNTVQGYPSPSNATTAFAALRTAWQGTLFQNLQQQGNASGTWQESFCQLGNFTTANGQAQQWYVCMARNGPYIVTVSIGGFPGLDTASVAQVVRTYFEEAQRALQ